MEYSIEALNARTIKQGECNIWTGAKQTNGYGAAWFKKQVTAHRAMYELTHGPLDPGLVVMHTCDNPACINPAHLVTGTQIDNMIDRDNKLRGAKLKVSAGDRVAIINDPRKQSVIAFDYNITHQHVSRIKLAARQPSC